MTRTAWFRYGFRETKRWLRALRQKRMRWAVVDVGEALARCVRLRSKR